MERESLYQDDLTEERQPTPADRAETSDTIRLDPDPLGGGNDGSTRTGEPLTGNGDRPAGA
jgi:hypothetical protein